MPWLHCAPLTCHQVFVFALQLPNLNDPAAQKHRFGIVVENVKPSYVVERVGGCDLSRICVGRFERNATLPCNGSNVFRSTWAVDCVLLN